MLADTCCVPWAAALAFLAMSCVTSRCCSAAPATSFAISSSRRIVSATVFMASTALGIELARAQRVDAALAGYCRETAVNRGQSLALLGIREGLEVGLDLALRRIHQLS